MKSSKLSLAMAAMLVTAALVAGTGAAQAAFPNFSDCPTTSPEVVGCIDIQNNSGNLNIKGFNVPLGASLEIRGGLLPFEEAGQHIVAPRGTNGFFARAVPVPGGLLGIEWIPGTSVLAITELAGPTSGIVLRLNEGHITIPVKVRLVNLLIGMNCHIGTDRNPVTLNLTTGTTSPPPPNRPITGHLGTIEAPGGVLTIRDNLVVENSFAVPGASECGLGLGLINSLVNAKLRLPSAGGNNSIEIHNDVAVRPL